MDTKTLAMLEYPKILARLAEFCAFSASAELALALQPVADVEEARARLAATTEARKLLALHDVSVGAAHDVRAQVDLAARGGVLEAKELLEVQATLVAMRDLRRFFEKHEASFPHLAEIALRLPAAAGLVEAISRAIAPNGEVLDEASPKLTGIRREARLAHERLLARLQRYLTDPETASKLQDTVITQRDGRYVIPLRAECKGQIKAIVHDQSSTGATLFVEPLAVVELNNAYRELQLAERDEIRRILAELSAQVGALAGEIIPGVAALAELDLTFAKAKYADSLDASEPILVEFGRRTVDGGRKTVAGKRRVEEQGPQQLGDGPRATGESATVYLLRARHPLLDSKAVVPITIDLPPGAFALVITGPNTGGKTVTLKTVGLLALMAQSGLHIPAESGSSLPCFRAIFADIGDEQSIEQSLSTFSAHMTNIIRILKQADERSLVILDELGAGTDPQEGSALARAILSHLLERRVTTFVATHYPELKAFAHTTPGVVNASLEFDIQTLRPTYQLVIGLPGRSNALAIAERLGLPRAIVEAARAEVSPESLRADRLIADIARQRKQAIKERAKAEKLRAEARRLERELAERLEKIEEERQKVLAQARAEGELELEVLKAHLAVIRDALKKARQPLAQVKEVEKQVEEIEDALQEQKRAAVRSSAAQSWPAIVVGESVVVKKLGIGGTVMALDGDEVEIQAGAVRVRARQDEVERRVAPERSDFAVMASAESKPLASLLPPSPGTELHLRGMRAEDALAELDSYLDKAYLAGLPFVRIVHGKGTGKLRQAIRQALRHHPHVLAFEDGREEEGGAGVTVVKLGE